MTSHSIALVAAVVTAAVLLVSGVSKVASPVPWKASLAGLGLPSWLATPVPMVELAVGALLLAQWRRAAMGWVAVALLVAFTALLAARLAQGQRPPCACFGSLSTKPIGVGHLVRNGVFIAVALLAALL